MSNFQKQMKQIKSRFEDRVNTIKGMKLVSAEQKIEHYKWAQGEFDKEMAELVRQPKVDVKLNGNMGSRAVAALVDATGVKVSCKVEKRGQYFQNAYEVLGHYCKTYSAVGHYLMGLVNSGELLVSDWEIIESAKTNGGASFKCIIAKD